jgi:hypothetical protein
MTRVTGDCPKCKYHVSNLSKALLLQKEASDALIGTLAERIIELESEALTNAEMNFIPYKFLQNNPMLIPDYVALAYKTDPNVAKEAVSSLHDESLDLSTLDCTGDDFQPWAD